MVKPPPVDDKAPAGKSFRSRFWNGNGNQRNTVAQGEPIGKQFDSNRQPAPDAWLKPADDENGEMPFCYTPFKTSTLGRESQVRGRTPQLNDVIEPRANGQKEQTRHNGTLGRPTNANNATMSRQPPPTNGTATMHRPQNGHAAPQQPPQTNGHNEPKMPEQQQGSRLASRASAYSASAFAAGRSRSDVNATDHRAAAAAYHAQQWSPAQPAPQPQQPQQPLQQSQPAQQQQQQQQHAQWSNVQQAQWMSAQQTRAASAIPPTQIPRAHSRAVSEVIPGSRYQSYTTLPRPELLDMIDHPGYGGGGHPVDMGAPPPMPLHPDMKTSYENALPPNMYPMHMQQHQVIMSHKQQQQMQQAKEEADDKGMESVNWSLVLKLAVLLMLLSVVVFGLGLARVLLNAKWGLGIELVYAVFVFIAGLLGILGAIKRHYCCVVACFAMSAASCLLAIPPMIIGLAATVPWTFSNVDKSYFVSDSEPFAVDIVLSAICLLQLSVGLIVAGLGCCTAGRVLARTDEMYLACGNSNSSHTEEKSTSTVNLIQ